MSEPVSFRYITKILQHMQYSIYIGVTYKELYGRNFILWTSMIPTERIYNEINAERETTKNICIRKTYIVTLAGLTNTPVFSYVIFLKIWYKKYQ